MLFCKHRSQGNTAHLMRTEGSLCHDCPYHRGHLTAHTCLSHFQVPSVVFSNTINLEALISHRTEIFTAVYTSGIFGIVEKN